MSYYFLTRVVLHRIDDSEDYSDLHAEMESRGFKRTIKSESGKTYRLPPAEYILESDTLSGEDVRSLAMEAVNAVMLDETVYIKRENKMPTVLVAKSTQIFWQGLTPIMGIQVKK